MQTEINIGAKKRDLRDFTRLILAFFLCLCVMALYQNFRLYWSGVLDSVLNKSLFLLIVHHLGFTTLIALILVFLFKILENIKANSGFKAVVLILVLILGIEGLLTNYYVEYYEILGAGFSDRIRSKEISSFLYYIPVFLVCAVVLMFLFYKATAKTYAFIGRMYPFTIVLLSLFLSTLMTRKNPVNENKTQYLVYHQIEESLDFNKYQGEVEYPLLKSFVPPTQLAGYFEFKKDPPNLVFIVMDGVGSDFIGEKAPYSAFMPYLNSLLDKSLYWPHSVSNTGETSASIPALFGSLPFGEEGYTNLETMPDSYTLFDLLRENDYQTSFSYGGNISLNNLGKFLHKEEVDFVSGRKTFGSRYKPQEPDAAGISLGYPDAELFRKWRDDFTSTDKPRLDVFLTQSTKKPFLIPEREEYEEEVDRITESDQVEERNKRLVDKNREIFASLIYADRAVKDFLEGYRRKAEFYNTIFIITGSHNLSDLPQKDHLGRYKVPLLIYSPLLKSHDRIGSLVAHTDVLPELAGLLHSSHGVPVPDKVAWLGEGLVHEGFFKEDKVIPLMRHRNNLQEFIKGNLCVSGSSVYRIGADLSLFEPEERIKEDEIKESFRQFKAINRYVTHRNKLLPYSEHIVQPADSISQKSDMVWINSVFNSDDFDNAYRTARDLAIAGETERALLLCEYILKEVPGHADTEILTGRIYAWNKQYDKAAQLLEKTIKKYPVYADAYSALLDVYFWSDTNYKVSDLKEMIRKHRIQDEELILKIRRAEEKMKQDKTLFSTENLGYLDFEENHYE